MLIRKATLNDLQAINDIYNHEVAHGTSTFDTKPRTYGDREIWFRQHNDTYPILVAETEQQVVGWASLSRYSDREAYSKTVEISIYLHPEAQGKGLGQQLMKAIMEEGRKAGLHTILARISEGNEVSIHLHHKFGFKMVGTMKEVGVKFGRLLDVYIMQFIYTFK